MKALRFDPDSERRCRKCRHAVQHNHTEYEDTHHRCTHVRQMFERGIECGHKSKKQAEAADCQDCWTFEVPCGCSEEDRLIADLRARIAELEAQR